MRPKQALMDEFLEATEDEDEQEQGQTVSRLTRLEALAMARMVVWRRHWQTSLPTGKRASSRSTARA